MCLVAHRVVDEGVGTKLSAALGSCPILGSSYQRSPDPVTARRRGNIPPLQICDRSGFTAVHNVSQRQFGESYRPVVDVKCQQHFDRFMTIAGEESTHTLLMVSDGVIRPERRTHSRPSIGIVR
jgi:hypothetical protein